MKDILSFIIDFLQTMNAVHQILQPFINVITIIIDFLPEKYQKTKFICRLKKILKFLRFISRILDIISLILPFISLILSFISSLS